MDNATLMTGRVSLQVHTVLERQSAPMAPPPSTAGCQQLTGVINNRYTSHMNQPYSKIQSGIWTPATLPNKLSLAAAKIANLQS